MYAGVIVLFGVFIYSWVGAKSLHHLRWSPSLYKGGFGYYNLFGSLVKGDSPQCGEMSRSDRGDGHRLGGGFAVGKLGGIIYGINKQREPCNPFLTPQKSYPRPYATRRGAGNNPYR